MKVFVFDWASIAAAIFGVALLDRGIYQIVGAGASIPIIYVAVCATGAGLIMLRRRFVGD